VWKSVFIEIGEDALLHAFFSARPAYTYELGANRSSLFLAYDSLNIVPANYKVCEYKGLIVEEYDQFLEHQ